MLTIVPITQKKAKKWVKDFHRHHRPPVGSVFQLGLSKDNEIVGVLMAGRPVARGFDDGLTIEVNRTCVVDGIKNGCSKLLGAAARVSRELGYKRIITYTLPTESGASLRAVGWTNDHLTKGSNWNCPSRPRGKDLFPECKKLRWVKHL